MPELEERCGERRQCRWSGLDGGGGARSDLSGCEWDLDLCKGKKKKSKRKHDTGPRVSASSTGFPNSQS